MTRLTPLLTSTLVLLTAAAGVSACASARGATSASASSHGVASSLTTRDVPEPRVRGESTCADCDAIPMPAELARAVETRIADLEARGGVCSRYGAVLARSYRSGRITIRPFMWRVGTQLASGEAKPNGEMTLAREIDELNVGVRTIDDVIRTMEHEAVHIAFDLRAGLEGGEDDANRYVRACSAGAEAGH